MLKIDCEEPWFSLLEKGIKPVEGRKGRTKYRALKPGDQLRFCCVGSSKQFTATVEKIESYPTVQAYLESVTLEKALPGIDEFDEGLEIYAKWSSAEEIETFGFLAIWIKQKRSSVASY